METVTLGWPLAVLLVALAGGAALVTRWAGLGSAWAAPSAALRATAQLAVVSLLVVVVLEALVWTAAFVALMVVIGALTSSGRITGSRRSAPWLLLPIAAGSLPPVLLAVASTAVPLHPVAVLPVAGILVGNAMTATTLAGRRSTDELVAQRGAYEAALSIGLERRDAVGIVARPAAGLALVPGLDQTRTVGLVTLPGAFVGVLLAGASPVQAGAAQLLVLVALLLVQAVSTAVTLELVAAGRLPVDGRPLPA